MNHTFGRPALLLILSVLLAACATSAEQLAERYKTQCTNRGYTPGTDAYADCLVRVEGDHEQRMTERRRELTEKPYSPVQPR